MSFISIFLMSFALAMDAFAVSVTKGMTLRKINFSAASKIALFFGIFQGIMPLIGWFIGIRFESYIKTVDHWIALLLLGFIGIKMILEAKNDDSLDNISPDKLEIKELIVLSIA
ncbi:MAG: manganese efflux pump, partial [Peptostreptococcaceae bacterium]|nr:manganese efflux pump [Peptostreptococcaceae bacterium]